MRTSQFETRHPTLLHLLIVGAAWAAYLGDREDVVWRMIRDSPSRSALERTLFALATVLIGAGAVLCTRARIRTCRTDKIGLRVISRLIQSRLLGDWLYALGIASLLPVAGCILLIAGESIRIVRLALKQEMPLHEGDERWTSAFRHESVKWGIFLTMIAFSASLVDRVADYGILASLVAWFLLNVPLTRDFPGRAVRR